MIDGRATVLRRPNPKAEQQLRPAVRWAAAEREAWLEAVTNDPLLPGRILPSDYLGQQAWWPPAKAGGGWKCSGTPAGNCARSNPNSPVQTFVAYATKGCHGRGRVQSHTYFSSHSISCLRNNARNSS
jgi:hypothetical protein